jgi:hypothetical protein
MYAGHHLEAALNNQRLFMEHQRADGRIPGSIALEDGRLIPQFNKFQGFCFPAPALNLYHWLGRDSAYLQQLQDCLARFDAYLWRTRDSDGDGCLESWCVTDTGEDGALRYGDAPFWWTEETPPQGCEVVPIASMDVMGYSFAARDALAQIARLQGNPTAAEAWQTRAGAVAQKIRAHLWSEPRGACFDRDRAGRPMPTLVHNNLRLMYWGALSPDMARRFTTEHLLNPAEFWTPMPLPSVAANDPLFRNAPGNNWSGQPQGLTYQRALRALENYGFEHLLAPIARKLFHAVTASGRFAQQYDPFTAAATSPNDGYGPTVLSVLAYTGHLYGIHPEGGEILWSCAPEDAPAPWETTLQIGDWSARLTCDGRKAEASLNGRPCFTSAPGRRVVTDWRGHPTKGVNFRHSD